MVGCGALRRNLLRKISALAAAGLVALVALWSPVAFAQTAAQTLADLFDGVSIPGLDNLPVGIIEAGDTIPDVYAPTMPARTLGAMVNPFGRRFWT